MQAQWLGHPADRFFIEHGAPQSSYALQDGGKIYSWTGGRAMLILAEGAPYNGMMAPLITE